MVYYAILTNIGVAIFMETLRPATGNGRAGKWRCGRVSLWCAFFVLLGRKQRNVGIVLRRINFNGTSGEKYDALKAKC
jgi:hypothetical protein